MTGRARRQQRKRARAWRQFGNVPARVFVRVPKWLEFLIAPGTVPHTRCTCTRKGGGK